MFIFLPNKDKVFEKFFLLRYTEKERKSLRQYTVKYDIESYAKPGTDISQIPILANEDADEISDHISKTIRAASNDFRMSFGLTGEPNLDWIEKFDKYFTKKRVIGLLNKSDPRVASNEFFVTCCAFGALLGKVLIDMNESVNWLYDCPFWESGLYDSKSGCRINIFYWAVKKFSNYGIDDGYRAKIIACSEFINNGGFNRSL